MDNLEQATHRNQFTGALYKQVGDKVYVLSDHGTWIESIGGPLDECAHMERIKDDDE